MPQTTGKTTTVTHTTTTRKSTRTSTVRCVCKVDKTFPLSPCGILKIIEMILGVIELAMIAFGRNAYLTIVTSTPSLSQGGQMVSEVGFYSSTSKFCLAMAIIIWLITILIFLLFLFCVPEMAGGNQIWNIVDLVLDILWVIFYFIMFILLCIICGLPTDHSVVYSAGLIVAVVFALLQLIAYILSLVFAFFAMKAQNLY